MSNQEEKKGAAIGDDDLSPADTGDTDKTTITQDLTNDGSQLETETTEDEPSQEDQIADLKDKLLRALADTENLRRRSLKDLGDARKYTSANFARDMLSVADNLRRAMESIPEDGDPDGAALVAFIEGISLTEKELLATLDRQGIKKIEPLGEKFDPQLHEAMFEVPTTEAEGGVILQVVESGYVIHDRLLRPAKVGVAKAHNPDSDDTVE
ncbi:MAG: nucleotide exchange factor GrpE [Pseudomonadota bacterium]|nr:nucleotide exchange factor GrpE [Pseudomonadota bacterium]